MTKELLIEALDLLYECRDALACTPANDDLYEKVWKWCQEHRHIGDETAGAQGEL